MHIEKKSDKCKIKRAKAIIQVKETIMQKVKDKIIPIILIAIIIPFSLSAFAFSITSAITSADAFLSIK